MAADKGPPFRSRSHEILRIEGLSDAVFGFAVTLLVVSLEVPRDFTELSVLMRGFLPFAISFAMLVWIWYTQHVFFRRYGLQDAWTVTLNAGLLFVVLFYIYPLKFLFGILVEQFSGNSRIGQLADGTRAVALREDGGTWHNVIALADFDTLMTIYGIGFAAMWAVFALLYWHAWKQRDALALTSFERHDTLVSLRESVLLLSIALLSIGIAQVPGYGAIVSGWIYGVIGPLIGVHQAFSAKRRAALAKSTAAEPSSTNGTLMQPMLPLVILGLSLASLSPLRAQTPPAAPPPVPQPMGFFITSTPVGDGGNLGGLAGADRRCQELAQSVGSGSRTWRAYLSAAGVPALGQAPVNARDRIGTGPWFNAKSALIAWNVADLHGDFQRDRNSINKEFALNEKGMPVAGRGETPNQHDILTGSDSHGRVMLGTAANTTCGNWTSNAAGATVVGHHDRSGGGNSSWNAAHPSRSCSQQDLVATGGAGLFYCFAT